MEFYHRAGIRYVLMGIDTTDPAVIEQVRKRSHHETSTSRLADSSVGTTSTRSSAYPQVNGVPPVGVEPTLGGF